MRFLGERWWGMNIEVLLTEAEIAAEFAESMEARDLP
jgi:hypothetical protein